MCLKLSHMSVILIPGHFLLHVAHNNYSFRERKIMKKDAIIESIKEVSLEELDQIIGAGNGVFKTISHECHLNTWAFLATCCS